MQRYRETEKQRNRGQTATHGPDVRVPCHSALSFLEVCVEHNVAVAAVKRPVFAAEVVCEWERERERKRKKEREKRERERERECG